MFFNDLIKSVDLGTLSPFSFSPLLHNNGSSNSGFPSAVTSIEITYALKNLNYTMVIVVSKN